MDFMQEELKAFSFFNKNNVFVFIAYFLFFINLIALFGYTIKLIFFN
jgi:hypothetical protein